MKAWQITVFAMLAWSCAKEEPVDGQARQERGKFSDARFLCDADNLALWAELKADGVDMAAYGLACDKGDSKKIVVRDSVINGETGESSSSADATGDLDKVPQQDGQPNANKDDEKPDAEDPPAEEPGVTYTAKLKQMIDDDCVSCHAAGGTPPRLDGYANAKAAGAASLVSIQNNSMPVGSPWSPADKAVFKEWADAGFPQ